MLARIRKSAEGNDKGFTLVELLVVMIIIGILAAVAIPVFLNQRTKAVDTSIKSDLRTAAQEIETLFVDSQVYPAGTAGSYVSVNASTVASGAVKVSGTNTIQYKRVTGGYCLIGFNSTSNATSATDAFVYDSAGGGLKPGAPATPAGNCA